jgi:molybdopterin/thiamine biosynthesis adenylyltransferase
LKFWWLIDTPRLAAERAAVEGLARLEGWFELERWRFHEWKLSVEGRLLAHGQSYSVRLVYPDQFPEVPAWVEPQDAARWTTHQYGKGTLCLELRPDNWTPNATGADVLRSAHNLLVAEDPLGEGRERATSAHNVGELQAYTWGLHPVLIGTGCRDRIRVGSVVEPKALRWMVTDEIWPILIHDAVDRTSLRRPPGTDINNWQFEISVYVSQNSAPAGTVDRATLVSAGNFDPDTTAAIAAADAAMVLFAGDEEISAFHLVTDGGTHRRRVFLLPEEDGARSGRTPQGQPKRIAIVGMGSVGSKVAENLIRSGVSHLRLVDGDVMLPGNLERHVLTWRDVGFRKVHGVKRRLLAIAPGADIGVIDENLNWQRSARTHAWQVAAVADCEVIVDATGDPATALFLGAVAESNARTFISVEVFDGGIGGLVATCIPARDPPFAVGRATFLAWCDAQGAKPPEVGSRRYEMLAEDGSPIIADDAAVAMTAGHAARTILDILDGDSPPIEAAWLLLGYRRAWIFDGHGHTIRLNVGERLPVAAVGDDGEAKAFVLGLITEEIGENKAGD